MRSTNRLSSTKSSTSTGEPDAVRRERPAPLASGRRERRTTIASGRFWRRSLANRLFASIFLSFLGLGTLITLVLVLDVVHRTEAEVEREIRILRGAFHDAIADQLWAYDQRELETVLEAMVRVSAIDGITVDDPFSGRRLASRGEVDAGGSAGADTFAFEVRYHPPSGATARHVGDAVLYLDPHLALTRAWPSIALILIAAIVKVLLVWVLYQFFATRQLARPLTRLTTAVDAVDVDKTPREPVRAVGVEDAELSKLQDAFNRLLERLDRANAQREESVRELVATRDRLEEAVAERTRALVGERRRAEEANVAKSRFLAMMSHELRTPLNSILGFSKFMVDEVLGTMNNPKYREYAEDIQTSAQHLLEVISDILDISKIEAGEVTLDEIIVDLRDVATTAERLISPRLLAKRQTLDIDIPGDLPFLRADGRILRQVIVNLFSNSVKFTKEGGQVRLRARLGEDDAITVEVEDNGIGIAKQDLPLVLEAFGQARASPDVAHEGTGLGLSLSKQLVEHHGGILSIASELDVGTTVTMTFPPERTVRLE